jgi:probable phosphoglycerate mutase
MREIWLVRHGLTAWARDHRHTGRTDVPLLPEGEETAKALAPRLDREWAAVVSSPLQRAWRTAELAGLTPTADPDLVEWDYGHAEGLTTAELGPGWSVWDAPDLGETVEDVAARVRRVLDRLPAEGDCLLVAHGHVLRILTAVYLQLEPRAAKHFVLEPARIGVLGSEQTWPAVRGWNL